MKPMQSGGGMKDRLAAAVGAPPAAVEPVAARVERPVLKEVGLQFIEIDPDNPRNLNLTWELLQTKGEGQSDAVKAKIADIYEFSEGLKAKGQLLPGVAYSVSSDRVRLMEGERRYWGLRLAGKTVMQLMVFSQKPRNHVDIRTLVNTERSTYKLDAMLRSLDQQEAHYRETMGRDWENHKEMAVSVGISDTRAFHLWKVRKGSAKVLEKALSGGFPSLEKAYEATRAAEAKDSQPKPPPRPAAPTGERRGRKKEFLSLGDVRDWARAAKLAKLVIGDAVADIPAGDFGALQRAWDERMASL